MFKKIFLLIFSLGLIFTFEKVEARQNATNWYIKNFDSKIVVNLDSTLEITERITADCGNAVGKHGIFRILPERINLENDEKIETPVKLISITDFEGKKINYTEIRNHSDKTVTWKIGDADKTVSGVNDYEIRYLVKNVIRFGNKDFDEFYWNLNGNFWDIEIDNFKAEIIFPKEIDKGNTEVEYYTGYLGAKKKDLANFSWTDNTLEFNSTRTILQKEGITASVTFPKNIFTPYQPTILEKYGNFLYLLIPLFVFIFCFILWIKYGKDPRINKPIIAEYDIPDNLSPIELGMLENNGVFRSEFVTAEIIYFASRGLMTIKEIENKILFFKSKDYEFIKNKGVDSEKKLNKPQNTIFNRILTDKKLSSLKNKFHTTADNAKNQTISLLEKKGLIIKSGNYFRIGFRAIGIGMIFVAISFFEFSPYLFASLLLSGIILFAFGYIMPKRTPTGAELNWKIKGFKLFMKTVDKDRARFYEQENIFEKFLPYAIVFGITDIWIKRIKELYGEEYFQNHAPLWYVGNIGSFNMDSVTNTINDLSSSIAANTSSSSGSGGGGFSGGGGGGGGGGGW